MIAEKNGPQAADSTAVQVFDYPWFKMPDLNRATHHRLGKSGAGWTFETIRRLVHLVARHGRPKQKKAAREFGRLGVGLQAIADEAGVSVAKVRRDLVKLVDMGLVSVVRRHVEFRVDPATGMIVENRTGRSVAVVVFLTVGPEHCRTKAGQDRAASPAKTPASAPAASPAKLEGLPVHDRDHSGRAIQRDRNTKREPVGDAVGIGTPPATPGGGLVAAGAPGLPAGEAGRHTPAKASQEGAADDGPVPVGRISRPAGKAPAPPRQRSGGHQFAEDNAGPRPFVGRDADRFAATKRRLDAEKAAREAQEAAWRAERDAGVEDPGRRLQEAAEGLQDDERDRADEFVRQHFDEAAVAADVQLVENAIRARVAAGAA